MEGIELDRTFSDKASGEDAKRQQLEALMTFMRAGDAVDVHSMDRLARNLDDLRQIMQTLTRRGIRIEFVTEHLAFTGEEFSMANPMLSVMSAFAEFERALIRERQPPQGYRIQDVGRPGFPKLTSREVALVQRVRHYVRSNTLRIAWIDYATTKNRFIIFNASGRPCTTDGRYMVLNSSCNEIYQRGENPYETKAAPDCIPTKQLWLERIHNAALKVTLMMALSQPFHKAGHIGDGPKLRDLPVCHSVDPNCGQRDVPMLLPVNRSQNHLRDCSIAFCDLLLHFDLDVIEITEPLREAFVVEPNGRETALFRSGGRHD